jgi:hypothetical protein
MWWLKNISSPFYGLPNIKMTILNILLLLTFSSLAFGPGTSGPGTSGQGNSKTAPTKCTLALAQAPALRGLSLGMNQAQVLARFPGLSLDRADEFGLSKLRLNFIDIDLYPKGSSKRGPGVQIDLAAGAADGRSFTVDGSKFPNLKGVRKIQLRFVDGRLSYVLLGYDDSFKWDGVDEFVQTVSKNLGLPDEWRVPPDSDRVSKEKELRCEGFLVAAVIGGDMTDSRIGAQLSLEDTAMTLMIEKRQKDREEKKRREEAEQRKTFKP